MSDTVLALMAQTMDSGTLLAAAGAEQAATTAGAATDAGFWSMPWVVWFTNVIVVLALFTLPFLFGNYVAKRLRMPTIGGRVGFATFVIAVTLAICIKAGFRVPLGVDIKGGTILVYEILRNTTQGSEEVKPDAVVTALQNRLNPSGTKEISIRPYGQSQIEVVVPATEPFEIEGIKKQIREAGQLKFRIVANQRDHQAVIRAAQELASSNTPTLRDVYNSDKKLIGQWYEVGRKDRLRNGVKPLRTPVLGDVIRNSRTGQFITPPALGSEDEAFEQWLASQGIENIDVLMALESAGGEPYVLVSGDDLSSASFDYDRQGLPAVGFTLNTAGSSRMFQLTAANAPDGSFKRRMAIILDERVLSAPSLNSPISTNGIIEGNFTREEVDFVVSILRAGKLPAALGAQPISEDRIGSLLGAATIEKGAYASVLSVIVTVACLLLYYRFSGFVAAFALLLNGLMILAMMILIQQPLTLPGLAGVVLTLGMAVDANVLVFERMREEIAKGSTPRMAIRNGFDRAFTTIVDSNLTTLIAAVVLYWIGTDQVRGFAVSLIIGILISMFTAVYCARIIFDISEKVGMISLSMSDAIAWMRKTVLGDKDVDFMSWQKFNVTISIVLILIGLVAIGIRGRNFLAIDFNGGTSATFQLAEPIAADKLRGITNEIFDKDDSGQTVESTLQRMEQEPLGTVYKIDTSFKDVEKLKVRLTEGLAKHSEIKLVKYSVITKVTPKEVKVGLNGSSARAGRLVAWQDPAAKQEETKAETKPTETTPAEAKPAEAKPADEKKADTEAKPQAEVTEIPKDSAAAAAAPNAAAQGGEAAKPAPKPTFIISVEFGKQNVSNKEDATAQVNHEQLANYAELAAKDAGLNLSASQMLITPNPIPDGWTAESAAGSSKWNIEVPGQQSDAEKIAGALKANLEREPVLLSLSNIGERVAGDMKEKAVGALLVSLIFIVIYIWFRFQKLSYGLAAVIALLHDVLITLGIVALCRWMAVPLGFMMIEDFKIDLIMVAAFLTIIGYSLNDTIVVFDRIREVRGKSPRLTSAMVNASVNQTLSRTLLTSSTTLLTILLLYFFGGEGIHGFSFALFIGIVVGTYSSIFIASPVLLWIANRQQPAPTPAPARGVQSRAV